MFGYTSAVTRSIAQELCQAVALFNQRTGSKLVVEEPRSIPAEPMMWPFGASVPGTTSKIVAFVLAEEHHESFCWRLIPISWSEAVASVSVTLTSSGLPDWDSAILHDPKGKSYDMPRTNDEEVTSVPERLLTLLMQRHEARAAAPALV